MHLDWAPHRAVQAKNAVAELVQHPGWDYLAEAFKQREEFLVNGLLSETPTGDGARYAEKIGELNAIRQFTDLVDGVIEYGSKAEAKINASELQPVA